MSITRVYPHDEFIQHDYSGYQLPIENATNGKYFMQMILADKGRDNQLLTFDGANAYTNFRKEFGESNFRIHGQSMLMAENILKAGGFVHAMRIMPVDASLANIILVAKIKVEKNVPKVDSENRPLYRTSDGKEVIISEGNTAIVRDVVVVKLTTASATNVKDENDIETALASQYVATADTDGFLSFPIMAIFPTGRGKYGNDFYFRITRNISGEKERTFRMYNLESYVNDGSLNKLDDTFMVSLYNDAIFNGVQEYIEQIVVDYSYNYNVMMSEDHYDMLVAEIKKTIPTMTEELLDILFCTDKTTSLQHYQMKLDPTSVDLTSISGIKLMNGSDGSFEMGSTGRDDAIEETLVKAYAGELDDAVLNRWSYPTHIIFDANFPLPVKLAIVALKNKRTDCVAIIDAGVQASAKTLLEWRTSQFPVDQFDTIIYGESGKVKEYNTKKDIAVTETYHLSTDLVKHINNGSHIPFAGMDVGGKASKYIKGTQTPVINNETMQDELYLNRINITEFFKTDRIRETEITTQYKNSDISFLHNVFTIKDLKRDLELLAKKKRYNFSDGNGKAEFEKDGNKFIELNYTGPNKLKYAYLRVQQTEQERRAKIMHWVVDVQCRDFILYNLIELNID